MNPKTYYIITLASLIGLLYISCHSNVSAVDDSPAVETQTPVTVVSVVRDTMQEFVELNATATFLLKSYIKANTNGYLQSSRITPGELVAKGQTLFSIRTKEAESIGNTINALDSGFKFTGTNIIHAAESGYITELNHQPGDYVQDGEQLAVINTSKSFVFIMNMPYELRPALAGKNQVQLELPDKELLTGTIKAMMPAVDSASQTQRVVIEVQATHPIPENLVARVRIRKTFKTGVIMVPKAAVLTDETQSEFWVMKLRDSVTAIKIPVRKGIENNAMIEIYSPAISEHDRVLVSGNYGLEDTARVKIIPSQQ
ncbi:efflux RND transporter periplasmic adaptor subunit [Chitinophaga ginsengisoli]|uniref:CusB/HlyD membrane fusion family barrel-sandwich protein n=1 Tax=Chitinophaga ginsengisoli TaxID=363837 RepID=A0A2P8FRU2_9BACT|nr:efflux RND transporter periplasmic adaptor subunit [Chitinophaga ginsengisoli]PSL24436.1 CusB/HlyD membrane fusion family barrel-sandwich protein [Chitinophaga ginsengisoli]